MSTNTNCNSPSALVVQYGARRQYAVPAAFARKGALAALYTDACATNGLGRWAHELGRVSSIKAINKLSSRRPPPEVACHVKTFDRWAIDMQLALRVKDEIKRVQALDSAHRRAAGAMIKEGFAGATHLINMYAEARGLVAAAKDQGLFVATDVYIAPSTEKILIREQSKHPGWGERSIHWGETLFQESGCDVLSEMIEKTDVFLCPSAFVQEDLVSNFGIPVERTKLNPYAVNPIWFNLDNRPRPGRILFAGEAGLRKGIHILAEAARRLRGRGRKYEFYIVGRVDPRILDRPEVDQLTFCGPVPFADMQDQFRQADILVLPTLAEGSAGVTYEAMGAGVPVVTTKAAGAITRDNLDGRIVPEGDSDALADAIESIIEDRGTRMRMSINARERAQQFTWDNFQSRLLHAVFGDDL